MGRERAQVEAEIIHKKHAAVRSGRIARVGPVWTADRGYYRAIRIANLSLKFICRYSRNQRTSVEQFESGVVVGRMGGTQCVAEGKYIRPSRFANQGLAQHAPTMAPARAADRAMNVTIKSTQPTSSPMMTFGKHYSPPREESTQRLHIVKANVDLWETLS